MAKVELKAPVVQEISEQIKDAQSVLLVKYLGLTVEQDTAMRKELREAGVHYKVYKNTMMNLAFKDTPFEKLAGKLEGANALAVHKEDPTVSARILSKYVAQYNKLNKDKEAKLMKLVAGVVDGSYVEGAGLEAVAAIPTREELLARLFGSMQSPIANFARVIKQIAEPDEAPAAEAAPAE
ncbi:MAG: 50S ribosomal protein L10 [Lachnospiraceae bacterium]|nr:50S ribosomal protein L10 [Lachnospiraceae bacterium]MBQ6546286.1 50S ribosomal protein L10 [Lachnospiraceae bacterium]